MIYCQNEDYNEKKILYNQSYDGNWKVLILSAILELF